MNLGGSNSVGDGGSSSASVSAAGASVVAGSSGAAESKGGVSSAAGTAGTAGNGGSTADGGSGSDGSDIGGVQTTAGAGGSSNTGVSFASDRVTVTGVRGVASPAASSVIRLHNAGTTSVKVNAIALSGTDAALFEVSQPSTFPTTVAPSADLAVTIELSTTTASLPKAPTNKDLGSVLVTANLTATLDFGSATAAVYGLALTQANYEPTLGQILTTLGYTLNVGKAQNNWNPNSSMNAANLPGVETSTDEVAASRFIKAGVGNVELVLLARFSPFGALPFGWYTRTAGCPTGCTTVGTMAMQPDAQTSDKARMVNPPQGASSIATFDPGSTPFGLWVYSDQKTQKFDHGGSMANGDWDYSQDALNTPANAHRFKSYPLKDIAHAYLIAIEEAGNGDYQDYVFLISNVTAMP